MMPASVPDGIPDPARLAALARSWQCGQAAWALAKRYYAGTTGS